jgi:hypothetical protein
MKSLVLSLLFFVSIITVKAQEFEVPQNYSLEVADDFDTYEQDFLECYEWLMSTPLNQQKTKRKEAYTFLMAWLAGSPKVKIEINPNYVTFIKSSPDMLFIFMGAWAKYSINSQDYNNKTEGIKAGLNAVIDYYNNFKDSMGKDKNIEKFIKMKNKGTLDDFIESNA